MKFSVITIFPDMLEGFLKYGLVAKAVQDQRITVDVYDLRDFTTDKHRKVDDRPFGGGPGMVLKPEPLFRAVESIRATAPGRVILFSAYGDLLNQARLRKYTTDQNHLIMICGRYEGVDQRVIDELVDEEVSIGEYVIMGGEVASEVVIEGASRLLPGVVGNPDSILSDSYFQPQRLGYPQYTQPRTFRGKSVPEVLLSGDHARITRWREDHRNRKRNHGE